MEDKFIQLLDMISTMDINVEYELTIKLNDDKKSMSGNNFTDIQNKLADEILKNYNKNSGYTNPINLLQEYCIKQKFPLPVYKTHFENNTWVSTCEINNLSIIGKGKNKKISKKNSAIETLKFLNRKI